MSDSGDGADHLVRVRECNGGGGGDQWRAEGLLMPPAERLST